MSKFKVTVRDNDIQKDNVDLGVTLNGYQSTIFPVLTKEQLREVGKEIFKYLAKKKNVKPEDR